MLIMPGVAGKSVICDMACFCFVSHATVIFFCSVAEAGKKIVAGYLSRR